MSRTIKHPHACPRPQCKLCKPWKYGLGTPEDRTLPRDRRQPQWEPE